jgi:hypothetical protein
MKADARPGATLKHSATNVFLYNAHRDDPDLPAAVGGIDSDTTALPVGGQYWQGSNPVLR